MSSSAAHVIPLCCNFDITILWSRVSNAFDRSMYMFVGV